MESQKSYYEQFDSEQKGAIQVVKTGNLNTSTGEDERDILRGIIKKLQERIKILETELKNK